MKLNVLMICPEFIPKMGGAEIQAFNLSRSLLDKGVFVRVLTRLSEKNWERIENIDGLQVERVDYLRVRFLSGIMLNFVLAWKILIKYRLFDVYHFHIGGNYMVLPVLVLKMLKKPIVIKVSGWWELERGFLRRKGILPKIIRAIFFRSDVIIALSDEIKFQLLKYGFPLKHIISLPNGVNTQLFYPPNERAEHQNIVFIGRLVAEKGVKILIQAIALLKDEFPNVFLDVIGDGYDREELQNMTKDLKIEQSVCFLGKKNKVYEFLNRANIYVQPSLHEGLPNSLIEAMACGLPVVVTNVGGMPDIVKDSLDGFVVEPSNVNSLANAIRKLLYNPTLRNKMGAAGRSKIEKYYSLEFITNNYITLYQQLLNRD